MKSGARKKQRASTKLDKGFIVSAGLFIGLALLFNLAIYMLSDAGTLDPLIELTTLAAAKLIRLVGISAGYTFDVIFLNSRKLLIELECTAVSIAALYSALVIAYPAGVKRKLMGLVVGVPAIFATNLLRLVVVAVVSERYPAAFGYVHDYIWQVAFVLLATGLWVVWSSRESKDESKNMVRP